MTYLPYYIRIFQLMAVLTEIQFWFAPARYADASHAGGEHNRYI